MLPPEHHPPTSFSTKYRLASEVALNTWSISSSFLHSQVRITLLNLFTSLSRSRVAGAHRTHSKTHGVSEGWETMSSYHKTSTELGVWPLSCSPTARCSLNPSVLSWLIHTTAVCRTLHIATWESMNCYPWSCFGTVSDSTSHVFLFITVRYCPSGDNADEPMSPVPAKMLGVVPLGIVPNMRSLKQCLLT